MPKGPRHIRKIESFQFSSFRVPYLTLLIPPSPSAPNIGYLGLRRTGFQHDPPASILYEPIPQNIPTEPNNTAAPPYVNPKFENVSNDGWVMGCDAVQRKVDQE